MVRNSRERLIIGSLFVLSCAAGAQTLPTGARVTGGSASIVPITPSLLTVQQSSGRAVINWDTFSISNGARVDFQQPNSSAAALNLVTGPQSSMIDGQLTGNGRVYLLNPSGVLIGATGQVNTGSFLAAAASTTPGAAGAWQQGTANTLPLTSGSGAVTVQSGAQVAVRDGGYLGLAGSTVSENGLLYAKLGKVQLAGGSAFTLDFTGDGLLSITTGLTQYPQGTSSTTSPVSVGTSGQISAEGGTVSISAQAAQQLFSNVIGIDGQVWARNATQSGNVIILSGSGGGVRLGAAARLDAGSTTGGGSIALSGDSVTLEGQSVIATTGATGGGSVAMTAPTSVTTSSGSQILTNSTTSGAGGSVAVSGPAGTAVGTVNMAGGIVATAGGTSGAAAGGSLSVAATDLMFAAPFFTTRPAAGAVPLLSLTSVKPVSVGTPAANAGTSSIGSGALGTALAGGADVTLTTTPGGGGSITINGDVNGRPAAAAAIGGALTLNAAGDVLLPSGIVSTQGSNITVSAGGVFTMQGTASLQAQSATTGNAQPSVNVSSLASCATAPAACTTTITDVQASGGLTVNSTGKVTLVQSLGVPPSGAASSAPTLGSLTVNAAADVQLGKPLQTGMAPTDRIDVANAMSVTAPTITASADLESANGSITLTGNTTLQAGVYANGPVTFNGDLTLDPRRLDASSPSVVFQGVDIGTTNPASPVPTGTDQPPTFYPATTVKVDVYQTTISSAGKGNITFGGNVGLSALYTPNSFATYFPDPTIPNCMPCLAPRVNFVVNAGTKSVEFSHGLANDLSSIGNLLVETSSPPAFPLLTFDNGVAANTVNLIESSGGPPVVGAPGGIAATVWVNQMTLNGAPISPDKAPSQVSFVLPQKAFIPSATNVDAMNQPIPWQWDMSTPPASSDSSAAGVPLTPLAGTGSLGGLSGNTVTPPSTIGGTPPGAPPPPAEAPSAPPGVSASAPDLTAATVTGWDVVPTGSGADGNSTQDTADSVIGGRGIGAEADLGRGTALGGAATDVFSLRRHVVGKQPCDAKNKVCAPLVDPNYLSSGAYP
jgi:filamentous hemagglutinin family protein